MTREETKEIFKKITMAYDNFESTGDKINFWHTLLEDITYEKALTNLIKHIQKSKFTPTVADIRDDSKKESMADWK